MIRARVSLSNREARDCVVDEGVVLGSHEDMAKAAVEAWWLAQHHYVGVYNSRGHVRDGKFDGMIFTCTVDNGGTPVMLDLSQAGGPW